MPPKPKLQDLSGKLNVVLKPEQITDILRRTLGPNGSRIGNVMLASNHCCVDASVGSSVAGPFSSVASSVSYPDPGRMMGGRIVRKSASKATIKAKAGAGLVTVKVPKGIKVK